MSMETRNDTSNILQDNILDFFKIALQFLFLDIKRELVQYKT